MAEDARPRDTEAKVKCKNVRTLICQYRSAFLFCHCEERSDVAISVGWGLVVIVRGISPEAILEFPFPPKERVG